jgi:hypothetical protein
MFHGGEFKIKSAGANSPRTGSSTCENPCQWLRAGSLNRGLIAHLADVFHIGIVRKGSIPFHRIFGINSDPGRTGKGGYSHHLRLQAAFRTPGLSLSKKHRFGPELEA